MIDWLDPVRAALAEADGPVRWFVRDDDGGWEDAALVRLLDRAAAQGVSVDIAVIPMALSATPAGLGMHLDQGTARVHQHGCRHLDRSTIGRKCEFGEERTVMEIVEDLSTGWQRLVVCFGERARPIFTPPWNRCSHTTARCLPQLGFTTLSRESGASRFNVAGLAEVPVTFDWFAKRKGVPLTWGERGELLATQVRSGRTVGIMLHHAVTGPEDLDQIERVFELFGRANATMTTIELEADRWRRTVSGVRG